MIKYYIIKYLIPLYPNVILTPKKNELPKIKSNSIQGIIILY